MLVKLQLRPLQLDVKFAVGAWLGAVAVTDLDVVGLGAPWLSVTCSVTVNVPPGEAYRCDGFGAVDVAESEIGRAHV